MVPCKTFPQCSSICNCGEILGLGDYQTRIKDHEKRRRRAGGGEEDCISELTEALLLQILSLLPLKSAIRIGTLSSRWRGLREQRWPDPSLLCLALPPGASVAALAEPLAAIDCHGRRRMDCFLLSFHSGQLSQTDLKRCIDYAAACEVEALDLCLDGGGGQGSRGATRRPRVLSMHFPVGSLLLARLSVRGLNLTATANAMVRALEVNHLHSVPLTDVALRRVVGASPCLRELELRYCRCLRRIDFTTELE